MSEDILVSLRHLRAHVAENGIATCYVDNASSEIVRLRDELTKANDAARSLFLSGDRLINERSEAWSARDALRSENDRLQAAIRALMSRDVGAHGDCECRICEARGRELVSLLAVAREVERLFDAEPSPLTVGPLADAMNAWSMIEAERLGDPNPAQDDGDGADAAAFSCGPVRT